MTINVLGSGGHAKVVIDTLKLLNIEYKMIHHNNFSQLTKYDICILAMGDLSYRATYIDELQCSWCDPIIHPNAYVSPESELGDGTIVMAGAIVQPGVVIGDHCILNTKSSIDHDCLVGDNVHIAPGVTLCGQVQVGSQTLIGIGSNILPGIEVGEHCIIGGGSLLNTNVECHRKAYGVPAHKV